jgi:quercetin dioxygenase-like cupin family protein
MERTREPETAFETHYESRIQMLAAKDERQRTGQVVVHASDIPFQSTRQGRVRYFLSPRIETTALANWVFFEHDVAARSGRHRHQGGLIIYVSDGRGMTEVDGLCARWQAGDVLLLPMQPGGAAHQHFNLEPARPCRFTAMRYEPFDDHAGTLLTQLEQQRYDAAGRPVAAPEGPPSDLPEVPAVPRGAPALPEAVGRHVRHPSERGEVNLFDWLLALRDWQRQRRAASTWVLRGADLPWELSPLGHLQWYLHPALDYVMTRSFLFYRQRIAPGGRSGRLRHPGDQIMRILSGRGHTVLNGVRHDWEAGDVVTLPVRQDGVIFQHFNDGEDEVLLMACEPNLTDCIELDRHVGWEVLEACPEYRD